MLRSSGKGASRLARSIFERQQSYARVAQPLPVILQEDVHNLGSAGAKVAVNQGYAHNYLLPNKLAIYDLQARFGSRKFKKQQQDPAKDAATGQSKGPASSLSTAQLELQEVMQRLLSQAVVVKRKFRRGQILEGQVTKGTIVDAIAKQRKVQIVPELLEMDKPILQHGTYDIPIGILKPDGQQALLEVIVRQP